MDRAALTVCIVDDDAAVRDSLKVLVESFGLSVRDYESAASYLSGEADSEPGCLLLDLHMPGMDGLELIELLRRRRVQTPAIIITGRTETSQLQRARAAGVSALLQKPVDEGELKACLDAALHGGPARC